MFRLFINCLQLLCCYAIYSVRFCFNSFNAVSNSDFDIGGPRSLEVISSSLSSSSSSYESLYSSSTYCCHLSVISSRKVTEYKNVLRILVQRLAETFLILREMSEMLLICVLVFI